MTDRQKDRKTERQKDKDRQTGRQRRQTDNSDFIGTTVRLTSSVLNKKLRVLCNIEVTTACLQ